MDLAFESPLNHGLDMPASPPRATVGLLPPGTLQSKESFYRD